jgi:hypothetical protein
MIKFKKCSLALLATAFIFTFSINAHAIPSTVAGTVREDNTLDPNNITLFDLSGLTGQFSQGVIEFDILGVTSVSAATLRIFDDSDPNALTGASGTVNLFGYTGNGLLDSSDKNTGSDISKSFLYAEGGGPFDIDVTTFVSSLVGSNFAGFNLRADVFLPIELGGLGGSLPQLLITEDSGGQEIPEPGALALLGIGLIGLGICRRPQKRIYRKS